MLPMPTRARQELTDHLPWLRRRFRLAAADELHEPSGRLSPHWPKVASVPAGQTGVADLYSGRSKIQRDPGGPSSVAARISYPFDTVIAARASPVRSRHGGAVRPAKPAQIPRWAGAGVADPAHGRASLPSLRTAAPDRACMRTPAPPTSRHPVRRSPFPGRGGTGLGVHVTSTVRK